MGRSGRDDKMGGARVYRVIKTGILNPAILSLVSRVRHTNTLVIADRGFPYWPQIETVDISLVDDVPTVSQVVRALLPNFQAGRAWMAEEFLVHNGEVQAAAVREVLDGIPLVLLPHVDFKLGVPRAIGLIRTGDASPYANMILESA
jgi:D-ribose pyranase